MVRKLYARGLPNGQGGKFAALSVFLFSEILVQTVNGGDDLAEVSGSKMQWIFSTSK